MLERREDVQDEIAEIGVGWHLSRPSGMTESSLTRRRRVGFGEDSLLRRRRGADRASVFQRGGTDGAAIFCLTSTFS